MIQETKHCLSHLTDFQGRDPRQTFWFYVLALVLLQILIGIVASIPMIVSMFNSIFDAAQSGADPADMEVQMMTEVSGWLGPMAWVSAAGSVLTVLLFVAAFVRRLHDAGFSGYWAAIPIVTQAAAVAFSISQIGEMQRIFATVSDPVEMQQLQNDLATDPMHSIAYIGYLAVIVFGVLKSQQGPNRYGEEPQRS